MNPLTLVKRIQNINAKEASLGLSEDASWHAKYRDSAYVFVGGVPFDLTEGDLLAVFSQCGEVVDVNLVRDAGTGKSKGFAFLAYQDQRSTILAVDNLNGAQILGRTIRVDHVASYKKKQEEDEETQRQKREERGVCRAFQRGDCTRGASCKFSHDEKRAANTGWGEKDKEPRWGHDKFDGPKKGERKPGNIPSSRGFERSAEEDDRDSFSRVRNTEKFEREVKPSYKREDGRDKDRPTRHGDDDPYRREEKRSRRDDSEFERRSRGEQNRGERSRGYEDKRDGEKIKRYDHDDVETRARDGKEDKRSSRHDDDRFESRSREDNVRGNERRSRMHRA